jgi:hypothetical protein
MCHLWGHFTARLGHDEPEMLERRRANTVRRGLVASAEDWDWSSARWYAGGRAVTLDMHEAVLAELAGG